ncbi:MAG: MaoC/PaaZ C-terminal domain-containing protein [Silicimonas sp.]|nr:MaoC/PaaZ C-terminal domain-containing protein [Silicimonas sp.]
MSETLVIPDRIDPARACALMATLGSDARPGIGDPLPPLAHFAFFWDPVTEDHIGPDGHAKLGGLIPDLGLPIRMWAGGRFAFHTEFRAGVAAERKSSLLGITRKEGRSGKLGFVTLRHDIRQRNGLVLSEEQDIVYREPGAIRSEPPIEQGEADERRALKLSEVTLFRYSAVTFNGHRIHYDAEYCRAEGYPGLVVHGPLLATKLAGFAAESQGGLARFSFRATAPLFIGDVAWLCRAGRRYWVEGPGRRICMEAEAA